jgi:hypothetical protein
MKKENFIVKSFKATPLSWVTTIFSSLLLVLNVWLTYRLFPVEESIRGMNTRIEAIESHDKNLDPLVERFYQVEEKQKAQENSITETKNTLIRIDGKLDKLVDLHIK